MRVFVAGGTGAIGRHLVPQLIAAGHEVVATTRSPAKLALLESRGAQGVAVDGLDRVGMMRAVREARPEVVVHEMTALDGMANLRRFDEEFALTNRLRTEGTDNLLAAARAAGARRVVVQSFAGWPSSRVGTGLATEDEPLWSAPTKAMRSSLEAIAHVERTVPAATDLEGVVLRYGGFYGPESPALVDSVRQRKFPLVGDGQGIFSFVHLADAASATVAAVERGAPGLYNIVDDEPAPLAEWLPYLANLLGAKPPRHVPTWAARLAAGEAGVTLLTVSRGSSNAKAKAELGWRLRYASWREGFRDGLDVTAGSQAA